MFGVTDTEALRPADGVGLSPPEGPGLRSVGSESGIDVQISRSPRGLDVGWSGRLVVGAHRSAAGGAAVGPSAIEQSTGRDRGDGLTSGPDVELAQDRRDVVVDGL